MVAKGGKGQGHCDLMVPLYCEHWPLFHATTQEQQLHFSLHAAI